MTEAWQIVLVALIAALPAIIAAFATLKGNKKIDVVHNLVNSRLTEATDALAEERTRNNLLQEMLLSLKPKDPELVKLVETVATKNGERHDPKEVIKSGDAVIVEKKV